MNTQKLNFNNLNVISKINKNEKYIFNEGDVVTGSIRELKDGFYNIELDNNLTIKAEKDKINGNVGDTVYFSVKDNKNTLKQINKQDKSDYVLKETKTFTPQIYRNEEQKYKAFLNKNSQPKLKESLIYKTKVKNSLSHLANTVNGKNLKQIVNNGINPKKIDTKAMSKYISESTGVDADTEEKSLIELKEEVRKNMKMDLNMNGVEEESVLQCEDILTKVGLPSTTKNVQTLENIKSKLENLESVDSNTSFEIIKKGNNVTLGDLYTFKYTGVSKTENIDIESIQNLEEQIKNVLKNNDLEVTKENIDIAKDFIKNGVDITNGNIELYKKLQNLKDNINIEEILEKSAKNILLNENILDVSIYDEVEAKYNEYKAILPKITPNHLQVLINNKVDINLENIVKNSNMKVKDEIVSKEAIEEKLKLLKLQFKLTLETMQKLYKKGITIDTKPLQEAINDLENLLSENYKDYLEVENINTKENVNTMTTVFKTIENVYPTKVYNTFGDIINNKVDFSLNGINKSLKSKSIIEDFDTFRTLPNKEFGDSINKLTDEFKKYLSNNNFEVNDKNVKALKILSLNNMDFNEENILKVKNLDSKVEYIANNLHPLTVSKMLKDAFNPLDKNIDDIIDYMKDNTFAKTSKEQIAEQILSIDDKLSKDEKDGVIAVYRMLNLIQKSDSMSIGNLLKTGKNITLENLLEASKLATRDRKNIKFDKSVDDNMGMSEKIIPDKNIVSTIQKAFTNENENYNRFVLDEIITYANPNSIKNIIEEDINISIEMMLDKLKNENTSPLSNITKQEIIENAQNLENINSDTINYLIKNNIPITLNNIEVMDKIVKEKFKVGKDIDDFKDKLNEKNISFAKEIFDVNDDISFNKQQMLNTVYELENENIEVFDDIINLDDLQDIKDLILQNRRVSVGLEFLKDKNNIKNGMYTVPIKLSNGNITDLNMYILNDDALNSKDLNLYLDFENINDNIQAYIKVTNNGNLVNISSDNVENTQKYENEVLSILNKLGINPDNIDYVFEEQKDLYKDEDIVDIEEKFKNLDANFNEIV